MANLAQARRLSRAPEAIVGLARLLIEARDKGELIALCEQLPLHRRKAYDLIAIAQAVDAGLLREADVIALGWTKARAIAGLAQSKADARRMVEFARDHTVPELQVYLATGTAAKRVVRVFHLTETDAARLDALLLANGAKQAPRGLVGRERALMRLVRRARQQPG